MNKKGTTSYMMGIIFILVAILLILGFCIPLVQSLISLLSLSATSSLLLGFITPILFVAVIISIIYILFKK